MAVNIKAVEPYPEYQVQAIKIIHSPEKIQANFQDYLVDESRMPGGACQEIVFAFSEKQVSSTVQRAFQNKTPLTVSAGRTGITGGAVPLSGKLISLEKMDHILGVRWDHENECWCMRTEPGLSLDHLQNMLENNDFDQTILIQNEKEKQEFEKFACESNQWFYPVDPTEKTAHIGGTVATNASGAHSFKFGPTRPFITKLRVVLAQGAILEIPRGKYQVSVGDMFEIQTGQETIQLTIQNYHFPPIKNVSGYFQSNPMDLIDLFIGSEGTLGVITEVEVMLRKKPEMILGVVAYFPSSNEAFHFVSLAKQNTTSQVEPSILEYFDKHALNLVRLKKQEPGSELPVIPESAQAAIYFEQACQESNMDDIFLSYEEILTQCGTTMDNTWGAMDHVELRKMTHFRHVVPEEVNSIIGQRKKDYPNLHKIGTDFVISDEKFDEIIKKCESALEAAGMQYVIFGHIGENHLHINMLPKNEKELKIAKDFLLEFAKLAVQVGGSVSGEHGIGKIKKELLKIMYRKDDLKKMKQIKDALDPAGILGQNTLF